VKHDAYGNVVQSKEQITDGPTRLDYSPVYANPASYVVDLPAYRALYQENGGTPVLLSQTLFHYDASTSYLAPVGASGEIRTVRQWDSTTGQYVDSTLEYDTHGLLVRTEDAAGGWVETEYDAAYRAFPVSSCSAVGCTGAAWNPALGALVEMTDLDGAVTKHRYDTHGRLSETSRPDGGHTTTRLLAHGQVSGVATLLRQRSRVEVSDGSAGDGVLWAETFIDGFGRAYRTLPEGGASQIFDFVDLTGNPARVSEVFAGTAPARYTTFTYDALGRKVGEVAPDGTNKRWAYTVGRIDSTDELGRTRTLYLDGKGKAIRVTDRIGGVEHDTTYGYDAAHRLIGSQDALGLTTSYYFDTLGRMIGESDPDRGMREYQYRHDGSCWPRSTRSSSVSSSRTTRRVDPPPVRIVTRMETSRARCSGRTMRCLGLARSARARAASCASITNTKVAVGPTPWGRDVLRHHAVARAPDAKPLGGRGSRRSRRPSRPSAWCRHHRPERHRRTSRCGDGAKVNRRQLAARAPARQAEAARCRNDDLVTVPLLA
jgi:YD repeat-containing protein